MRWTTFLWLVWAVCGCSDGSVGNGGADAGDDAAGEEECSGRAACPNVVDGRFTGWSGPGDEEHEWATAFRLAGVLGTMYARVCETTLYFLNDWHLNVDGPIDPECYNLFFMNLNGRLFEIRVYGDQEIEVLLDGEPYDGPSKGATTFTTSPEQPLQRHTVYEFSLELPELGDVSLCEADPQTTSNCDSDDELVQEPTILKGTLQPDGGIEATGEQGLPFVTRLEPRAGRPGDLVTIMGVGFGAAEGSVRVAGRTAVVQAWAQGEIRFVVPPLAAGEHWLRVVSDDTPSPAVRFEATCGRDCTSRECGDDGCGGSCGTCPGFPWSCADGACGCAPQCQGRQCGPDQCGGTCGACGAGTACEDGRCRCQPDCSDRQCGSDGCGGSCGACGPGLHCAQFLCVCDPECTGLQCGSDGCGGSCGVCPAGRPCVDGRCLCSPDCAGRQCGDDGCGGSCGTCGAGSACVGSACLCVPSCAGKACGDDGCGTSCGSCDAGLACVAGQCACLPQCDGRECGEDGCGGSCGTCAGWQECAKNGVCVVP